MSKGTDSFMPPPEVAQTQQEESSMEPTLWQIVYEVGKDSVKQTAKVAGTLGLGYGVYRAGKAVFGKKEQPATPTEGLYGATTGVISLF